MSHQVEVPQKPNLAQKSRYCTVYLSFPPSLLGFLLVFGRGKNNALYIGKSKQQLTGHFKMDAKNEGLGKITPVKRNQLFEHPFLKFKRLRGFIFPNLQNISITSEVNSEYGTNFPTF